VITVGEVTVRSITVVSGTKSNDDGDVIKMVSADAFGTVRKPHPTANAAIVRTLIGFMQSRLRAFVSPMTGHMMDSSSGHMLINREARRKIPQHSVHGLLPALAFYIIN
jgi:hypothetical protein